MVEDYNKSEAESKPRKLRETLTDNADGNPEPSPENWEGAETRHGVCLKCGGPIPPDKYSSAVYCSHKCRNAYISYRWRVSKGLIKKPGIGSGNAQEKGPLHPTYKTGIGDYSKRGFEYYGRKCNRCGDTEKLLVHHRDENRKNNELDNLEVLCKYCHQDHHCIRNEQGKYQAHPIDIKV